MGNSGTEWDATCIKWMIKEKVLGLFGVGKKKKKLDKKMRI